MADDDSAIERRVGTALDDLAIDYTTIACDPDFADTAAFCERYGVAPEDSANTIVLVAKAEPRRYAACVVLATNRLDVNGAGRRLLGARRVSFAGADETREVTGMMIGGVTPFALPGTMPLYVAAEVMERRSVVLGGGSRSLKIKVSPPALLRLPRAEVVADLAQPLAAG